MSFRTEWRDTPWTTRNDAPEGDLKTEAHPDLRWGTQAGGSPEMTAWEDPECGVPDVECQRTPPRRPRCVGTSDAAGTRKEHPYLMLQQRIRQRDTEQTPG